MPGRRRLSGPQVRLTLGPGLGDRPGAPVGINFHGRHHRTGNPGSQL